MQPIQRHSFMAFAFPTLPYIARAQSENSDRRAAAPRVVPAGADRFGRSRPTPTGSPTFKIASLDSGGALFVMEQARRVVFEAKAPADIVIDVRGRLHVRLGL